MKKFVLIGQTSDFIQCIGVYDNPETAYGKAYLYLDDQADSYEYSKCYISKLEELEVDTGFRMYLVIDNEEKEWVDILFYGE